MKRTTWAAAPCWAVVAAALLATSAGAQIEEIVVTAQKRTESIQEVPLSITVLTGEDIEARGLYDAQELARQVPNFDLPRSNNMRNVSVRIRGIGSSGTNAGIESSVGVFLDGLYMPSGAMSFGELADIQSYEILRGPQGTLYGRNTPVGALNVTTRRPSREPESMIRLGDGDFDQYWLNGYVGGALSDTTAGRLTFWTRDRDGYVDNTYTGEPANDSGEWGLRGKLLLEPTDSVEVTAIAYYSEIERGCCMSEQIDPTGRFGIATPGFLAAQDAAGYGFNNFDDSDHKVDGDDEGDDRIDSMGASVQIDWRTANDYLVTSITGYQDWENDVLISADSLRNPMLTSRQVQSNQVTSQEFRITSPASEGFEFLAGLFLYAQDTTLNLNSAFGAGATRVFPAPSPPCGSPCTITPGDRSITGFDQETRSVAAYGSATWHVAPRWDVTTGLRFSRDEKDVDKTQVNEGISFVARRLVFSPSRSDQISISDNNVTWSLDTRYMASDDVMAFARVATGFKSGGVNSRGLPPGSALQFDNEDSISYELGVKSTWLDRRLMLNATLYWTVVEGFQESALAPTGTGFIVGNAGEQEARGFEADLWFQPAPDFTVNASVALLDAEYTEFPDAQCGLGETPDGLSGGNTCNRAGDTPAFAPKWKYTVGAEWRRPIGGGDLEWRLRADYSWVDQQNLIRVTQDPPADQDAYGLLNVRAVIGKSTGRWEAEVFAHNATNEAYFMQAALQPLGGLVSAGGFAGVRSTVGWYGPLRVWGVQFTWRPGI